MRPTATPILFTADVPLPAVAGQGPLVIRYNIGRVLALDENLPLIQGDLPKRIRAVRRRGQGVVDAHNAAWPPERREAETDAYADAVDDFVFLLAQQRTDITRLERQWNLAVIADVVVGVLGLAPEDTLDDPTDAAGWDGWADNVLAWVAGAGVTAAKEQMTGPKAPPASGTTMPSPPIPGPPAPSASS